MENRNQQSLMPWVILGLGVLAVVKLWQSGRKMFWIAIGMGWVMYWTGGGPFS